MQSVIRAAKHGPTGRYSRDGLDPSFVPVGQLGLELSTDWRVTGGWDDGWRIEADAFIDKGAI